MAGRGRGRGRGAFNKALGLSPEDVPPPLGQPPPTFPALQFKPVPLVTGKKILYTLTLKQEIRSSFKESGYSIPPVTVKKDIERYTDKYQPVHAADQIVWDKAFFPKELFDEPKKKKRKVMKKQAKTEAVVEKLKLLEAKEETEEEEEEKEEEAENEEEYDEEELEEV
ncbi:DNA-directed RNA polymerase III subunit RPC7, partial [Stegodyphus mimosarum]